MADVGIRDSVEDRVKCWWIISGVPPFTGREGTVVLMSAWAVVVDSRCSS